MNKNIDYNEVERLLGLITNFLDPTATELVGYKPNYLFWDNKNPQK